MGSKALLGKLGIACLVALGVAAACKSSTAEGNAGPGAMGADGGMMGGDGGMMMGDGGMMGADGGMTGTAHDMGHAAGSAARDVGSAASTAGSEVKEGAQTAGQTVADAGSAAMGAARDTASGAATTASDAAKGAATGAREGMDGGTTEKSAGAEGSAVTEPQIAKIAWTANTIDIDAAKLALKQTKNAKVKEFANLMIKDHTSANKQAQALVKKLGITPEDSDTSRSLKQAADEETTKLKSLKGKEFDREYISNEVTVHENVVKALDDTLIPGAKNAELKSLLTKVRGVVQRHLEHAKSLQSSMNGGAAK